MNLCATIITYTMQYLYALQMDILCDYRTWVYRNWKSTQ